MIAYLAWFVQIISRKNKIFGSIALSANDLNMRFDSFSDLSTKKDEFFW